MKDYSESSDEELLKEYHTERNPYLLNILFKRHANVGFRTAMRYMRNQPDAEDVLQLAFIHFLQNLHLTREGSTNVKAWLMKVIVNISIDKLREEKRRARRQQNVASERFTQFQQKENLVENNNDREELKNKIKICVDTLPEKYRSPIWLVLYEGFSYPEVASVLALPEKTVRTQVSRGLERLREILGSFGSILSVSLITELIKESKLDIAPASVNKIIDAPELYQTVNSQNQQIILHNSEASVSYITKYLLIGLAIIFSVIGIYYYANKSNAEINVPVLEKEPIHLALDFNDLQQKIPYFFSGEYRIIDSGGLKKSGSLECIDFFTLKIPVEKEQLPLKITYRYNVKFEDLSARTNIDTAWGNWDKLGVFYMTPAPFSKNPKLNEYVYEEDRDWVETTIWASENCIDYWINGKRVVVFMFNSEYVNKNFYLKFYSNMKIDNLLIDTIQISECPNILQFKMVNDEILKKSNAKFSEKISLEKHFPQYVLPNFEPNFVVYPACSENENREFFKSPTYIRTKK